MFEVSISTVVRSIILTVAPSEESISSALRISLISGRFSITHLSPTSMVPSSIGSAAFFIPPTVMLPCSFLPPLTEIFSIYMHLSDIIREQLRLVSIYNSRKSDFVKSVPVLLRNIIIICD